MSAIEQVIVRIQIRTQELASTPDESAAQDRIQRMSIRQVSIPQAKHADDPLC